MSSACHGIYAAAITPLNLDLTVDHGRLAQYCGNLIATGRCDGVAPAGTTGEGPSLSLRDRLMIPKWFRQAGLPPNRVILGIGTASFGDTVTLAKGALAQGYANLLILPPFYYKNPDDDSVYDYFARLATTIDDERLRIYLYNFPQMTTIRIAEDVVKRLRSALGKQLKGLKDSSGDASQVERYLAATGGRKNGFDLFPSTESLLPAALEAGCAGIISATANLQAGTIQTALAAGPEAPVWQVVNAVRHHLQSFPLIAAIKTVQARQNGDDGWRRMLPPQTPLSTKQEARLIQGLQAIWQGGTPEGM